MKKMMIILTSILLVSCASIVRNADVPNFEYDRTDFNFGDPSDVTISLKPSSDNDGSFVTETGVKVFNYNDLETVLEAVYPNADAFIYGKVTQENRISSVPFINFLLSAEKVYTVRSLQIGKHK